MTSTSGTRLRSSASSDVISVMIVAGQPAQAPEHPTRRIRFVRRGRPYQRMPAGESPFRDFAERGGAVLVGSKGVDASDHRMAGGFHLCGCPVERPDDVRDVVEPLAALLQPVGMDARTVERLDELELRTSAVQRQAERPVCRSAPVLVTLPLRTEDPPTPRPRLQQPVELTHTEVEVAHDEPELERRQPV